MSDYLDSIDSSEIKSTSTTSEIEDQNTSTVNKSDESSPVEVIDAQGTPSATVSVEERDEFAETDLPEYLAQSTIIVRRYKLRK